MKFVCDQCKAKYQISDDKVVGKTVKMKCRKCGHMIEVRAAVTETSVATSNPRDPADDRGSPSTPPSPTQSAGGSSLPRAGGVSPPRPGAPKTSPLATSLAAQRPAAQKPAAPLGPGALAGAFNRSIQKEDDAAPGSYELRRISSADEWYAAINGVPVGPIRIAELRRKAALGAVTEESLVWQEGLEEWRPVRAFPELAEMVREAAAIGRPSLLPPAAWEAPPVEKPTTSRPGSVRPGPPLRAPAPAPRSGLTGAFAKSNVIPISSRLATAEKLEEISVAVAAPEPPIVLPAIDPFARSSTTPQPAGATPVSVAPPAPQEPRRPFPWFPVAMVAAAVAFAVTFAIVLALPKPVAPAPAPSVVIIQAAAPTLPTATDTTAAIPAPAPSTPSAPSRPGSGAPASPGASKPAAAPAPGKIDIGGLLGGPGGPNVGPGGAGASAGGGSLSQSQIEQVVASRKIGVRRACLERAQSEQGGNVTIRAKVTVGGNGTVQNVTATGNDPAIAACIEKNVRGWTFPAAGGTTTFDIPFSFVRQ